MRKLTVDYVYIQIHFSPGKIMYLKRCFDDILNAAASSIGIHPKMESVFDNVFKKVEEVGEDIGKDTKGVLLNRYKGDLMIFSLPIMFL